MTRSVDPFPKQGRILGEFTVAVEHDPLEAYIAQMRAQEQAARDRVAAGHVPDADPQDLRGIPCIARGTGGTSPGTNPLTETIRRLTPRKPR